jgi:hypothetical protein
VRISCLFGIAVGGTVAVLSTEETVAGEGLPGDVGYWGDASAAVGRVAPAPAGSLALALALVLVLFALAFPWLNFTFCVTLVFALSFAAALIL